MAYKLLSKMRDIMSKEYKKAGSLKWYTYMVERGYQTFNIK